MKRITSLLLALIMICLPLCACDLGQIEDTNGEDDYSLCSLTDEDIVKKTTSSVTSTLVKNTKNGVTTVKVGKLSGVTELDVFNPIQNKVLAVTAAPESGNVRLVLVRDETIVCDVPLNGTETLLALSAAEGRYSFRAAGESASFRLTYEVRDWPADWDVSD